MNWEIKYKKDAWKFISKNKLVDKFEATIIIFIKGEGRIDLKKLAGKLEGNYRFMSFFCYSHENRKIPSSPFKGKLTFLICVALMTGLTLFSSPPP